MENNGQAGGKAQQETRIEAGAHREAIREVVYRVADSHH